MKKDNPQEFSIVKARLGSDTLQKLGILHHISYPASDNATLDLTISFCIELAYSALKSRQPVGIDPLPLTPPKTKKAQEIYKLYQIIMTLKANGMNTNQIVKHMNDSTYPTVDELYSKKMLKYHMVKKWKIADVAYLSNVEELNSLIKVMNRRRQRPIKHS